MKFDIWVFFENLRRKLKFRSNQTRIKGTLHEDQYIFLLQLAQFFLEWETSETKFVEKIETHILCPIPFFFEFLAVNEVMWKNIVQVDRTTWRMRIACWVPKTTNTLRICNTYCYSTASIVARKRLTCYVMLPVLLIPRFFWCCCISFWSYMPTNGVF